MKPDPARVARRFLTAHHARGARLLCVARERAGQIPFPQEYEEILRLKGKNQTLRVDEEVGIYQEGATYEAVSYGGEPWDINIEIQQVVPLQVWELPAWGIPEEDIERVQEAVGSASAPVELIRFTVL